MPGDETERERRRLWETFDPNDPSVQILLLSQRVDTLCKEKESLEEKERELEKRMAKMENSFQRGAGILMILPILGTLAGLVLAYGKVIFRPWTGTP